MKEWQFNILFFVGVAGAIFLVIGPEFGLDLSSNPTALAGVGSILTYILTQKSTITKHHNGESKKPRSESPNENDEENNDPPKSVYGDPD